jgi:hypothetical protein
MLYDHHLYASMQNVLRGIIRLLRQCEDAGIRRRGEPPLEPEGRCDLCGSYPEVGRLLIGCHGLGFIPNEDGCFEFDPWKVDNSRDGMYWLCMPCWRMLDHPEALLRRFLDAHGTPRN